MVARRDSTVKLVDVLVSHLVATAGRRPPEWIEEMAATAGEITRHDVQPTLARLQRRWRFQIDWGDLGEHPNGHLPFEFDITPQGRHGDPSTLVVPVDDEAHVEGLPGVEMSERMLCRAQGGERTARSASSTYS